MLYADEAHGTERKEVTVDVELSVFVPLDDENAEKTAKDTVLEMLDRYWDTIEEDGEITDGEHGPVWANDLEATEATQTVWNRTHRGVTAHVVDEILERRDTTGRVRVKTKCGCTFTKTMFAQNMAERRRQEREDGLCKNCVPSGRLEDAV